MATSICIFSDGLRDITGRPKQDCVINVGNHFLMMSSMRRHIAVAKTSVDSGSPFENIFFKCMGPKVLRGKEQRFMWVNVLF